MMAAQFKCISLTMTGYYISLYLLVTNVLLLSPQRNGVLSIEEDKYPCAVGPPARSELCDENCRSLTRLLKSSNWELERGIIYILTKPGREGWLERVIMQLELNFKYYYPLVIFYEYMSDHMKVHLQDNCKRPIFFQEVDISTPKGIKPKEDIKCLSHISYRNMCRFQAKCAYKEPILEGAEYLWRLDDDSEIRGPIDYDVFKHMREEGYLYGYMFSNLDNNDCTANLWPAADEFIKQHNLSTTFFQHWPQPSIFYNNFEISKASLWRGHLYQDYINYLDSLLGIYEHRWGDAPMKGIFVSIVVNQSQLRWFGDIHYYHNNVLNNPVPFEKAKNYRNYELFP